MTRPLLFAAILALVACGGAGDAPAPAPDTGGDAQTPPAGGPALEVWLAGGAHKRWHCEAQVHGPRSPSLHGLARICTNDALTGALGSEGEWPVGAAAVAELYHLATDDSPVGYAVARKTAPASARGAGWYWYQRTQPAVSKLPHDARGLVADGLGADGAARAVCVACHAAAGSDEGHTPSPFGHDLVYTPVP
jgi:hypothetical protein